MFVKSSSTVRVAFKLESVVHIQMIDSTAPFTIEVTLDGGIPASLSNYATKAEAEAAFDSLLEMLGWVKRPEGEV